MGDRAVRARRCVTTNDYSCWRASSRPRMRGARAQQPGRDTLPAQPARGSAHGARREHCVERGFRRTNVCRRTPSAYCRMSARRVGESRRPPIARHEQRRCAANSHNRSRTMPRYIIERTAPGLTREELEAVARRSMTASKACRACAGFEVTSRRPRARSTASTMRPTRRRYASTRVAPDCRWTVSRRSGWKSVPRCSRLP